MDSSSNPTAQQPQQEPGQEHSDSPALLVDFAWKSWTARVSEASNPSETLYTVDFRSLRRPFLVFKTAADGATVGTGDFHTFSIHADYEMRGRRGKLKALKRWQTQYTHLSHTYADDPSPSAAPVGMTWASSSGFKTWDFVCLDEAQMPVARFSANMWDVRRLGRIEFMGPLAGSAEAREEILIVGLTLLYCMLHRTMSIFSFFGAIFARPGPLDKGEGGS